MKPSALGGLLSSPSNLVFLAIAATLCAGFFLHIVSQENFVYIAGQVFAFYFGRSQAKNQVMEALMATPPAIPPSVDIPKEG